jgi:hypothetical protein
MNREHFIKCLREGNAMKEAKYVAKNIPGFSTIPFPYNKKENKYEPLNDARYSIYRYIYFKLETLLGYDFMSDWAVASNDPSYLSKANDVIDTKYGSGTFKKLYYNIQLILLSMINYSTDDLAILLGSQHQLAPFYNDIKDISMDNEMQEYQRISNVLKDYTLFEREYEAQKASLISTKEYFQVAKLEANTINNIDQKIKRHTKENYRLSLQDSYDKLQKEIEVKANVKSFKRVTAINVLVCQEAINNPNYLSDAIVQLESLIAKCLIKELNDEKVENYADVSLQYNYYINNMGSKMYDSKIMRNVRKNLELLKIKILFGQHVSTNLSEDMPSK